MREFIKDLDTRQHPPVLQGLEAGPITNEARAGSRLLGRRVECETLDGLISAVHRDQSAVLVIRGEPGAGKTTLLDYVAQRTSGARVERVRGFESESDFAFAGLHQVCAPMLDLLDRLPQLQSDALRRALGQSPGETSNRFLVGLAVLGLFTAAAEAQPLIYLVDDAQWLDVASLRTIAFVGRRLQTKRVALLLAFRDAEDGHLFGGFNQLQVQGLDDNDARLLLASVITGPLDQRVRDRIISETRGNPRALLELRRGLQSAEMAGGFGSPETLSIATDVDKGVLQRLQVLPPDTRRLLLAAALDPIGDASLLWRAAARLGVGVEAMDAAKAAGLVEVSARVQFRHPFVRSAVYRAADIGDIQQVHTVLADVTDPDLDPDQRAWHRALAAAAPDEEIAAELERAAPRAGERGGVAAEAAFLDRAARLTVAPTQRARRALDAALKKQLAGATEAAHALLSFAEAEAADTMSRSRVQAIRSQIAFASKPGPSAVAQLLEAAEQLEPVSVDMALRAYSDALSAALLFAGTSERPGPREVAANARSVVLASASDSAPDLLLRSVVVVVADGYAKGTPILRSALRAVRNELSNGGDLRWLSLAGQAAQGLWDEDTWDLSASRHLQVVRRTGALAMLPAALYARLRLHLHAGELADAAALQEEIQALAKDCAGLIGRSAVLAVAAWQGNEALVSALMAPSAERNVTPDADLVSDSHALAVLYNGIGRYDLALQAAKRASEHPEYLGSCALALPEVVESASRSTDRNGARLALEQLSVVAQLSGTNWALGTEARCRALLSSDDMAERYYRESIDHLRRTRLPLELARSRLVYGEWLRRIGRRVDAREQLRAAHGMLASMGAAAFAERARRELLATGERARKRSVETQNDLTAQEAEIARLAAMGSTNPEIGAELFISPRTVEWHLRKVYPKLGITSRRGLRDSLPDQLRQKSPR